MRALVGTTVVLLALAGCGDDNDDDAAGDQVAACADLTGETIEEGFEGCLDGDELQAVSGTHECVDGRVLTVVGTDIGWAFEGEEWHTGDAGAAVSECYTVDLEPTDEPTDDPTEETDEPTEEPTDDSDVPTTGPGVSDSTACEDIWVEGEILPAGYYGCTEDGREVPAAVISCTDGSELTAYQDPESGDDLYYATLGEEIMPSADQEAFAAAFSACFG